MGPRRLGTRRIERTEVLEEWCSDRWVAPRRRCWDLGLLRLRCDLDRDLRDDRWWRVALLRDLLEGDGGCGVGSACVDATEVAPGVAGGGVEVTGTVGGACYGGSGWVGWLVMAWWWSG